MVDYMVDCAVDYNIYIVDCMVDYTVNCSIFVVHSTVDCSIDRCLVYCMDYVFSSMMYKK